MARKGSNGAGPASKLVPLWHPLSSTKGLASSKVPGQLPSEPVLREQKTFDGLGSQTHCGPSSKFVKAPLTSTNFALTSFGCVTNS